MRKCENFSTWIFKISIYDRWMKIFIKFSFFVYTKTCKSPPHFPLEKKWSDDVPPFLFVKLYIAFSHPHSSMKIDRNNRSIKRWDERVRERERVQAGGGVEWWYVLHYFQCHKTKTGRKHSFFFVILKHVFEFSNTLLLFLSSSLLHEFLSLPIIALLKPSSVQWIFNLQILYVVLFSIQFSLYDCFRFSYKTGKSSLFYSSWKAIGKPKMTFVLNKWELSSSSSLCRISYSCLKNVLC